MKKKSVWRLRISKHLTKRREGKLIRKTKPARASCYFDTELIAAEATITDIFLETALQDPTGDFEIYIQRTELKAGWGKNDPCQPPEITIDEDDARDTKLAYYRAIVNQNILIQFGDPFQGQLRHILPDLFEKVRERTRGVTIKALHLSVRLANKPCVFAKCHNGTHEKDRRDGRRITVST